jgi:hypothetical protein
MNDLEKSYHLARKVARQAAADYNPFEKVTVRGPLEGNVTFSDGSIYIFREGMARIHRKNLNEAFNLGCRRVNPSPSEA